MTDIPNFTRRRIQAEVIAPLYEEMKAELGELIVREIPRERSEKVLRQVAGHLTGTMAQLWKLLIICSAAA